MDGRGVQVSVASTGPFVTLLMACIASQAYAADWKWAAKGQDGTVAYVDTSSIRQGKVGTMAWIKWDYSNVPSNKAHSAISLDAIRCSEQLAGVQSYISYSMKGEILSSGSVQDYQIDMTPIVPDSMMVPIAEMVCERAKPLSGLGSP